MKSLLLITLKKYSKIILSVIQHYNHEKYWRRRNYVISCNGSLLLKLYYLYYIKKTDYHWGSSFGTDINNGSVFDTPPFLPHGPNGIIVGHDAKVGKNLTIYQHVTIAHGNVIIGDNVMLGAGAVILPNVTIGDNVKVGAKCVVIENIPNDSTVVLSKPRIIIKDIAGK